MPRTLERIESLRRRLLRLQGMRAGLAVSALGLAIVLCLTGLDLGFGLPRRLRRLAVLLLGALVALAVWRLGRRYRPPSSRDLARQFDAATGGSSAALEALELEQELDAAPAQQASDRRHSLTVAAVQQLEASLAGCSFDGVLPRKQLHRTAWLLGGLGVIAALAALLFPAHARVSLQRLLLLHEVEYPTRTRIAAWSPPPGGVIAAGDPLHLEIRVDGEDPATGHLEVMDDSGARPGLELVRGSRGVYRGRLIPAAGPLRVRARIGDARSSWISYASLARASLQVTLWVRPPGCREEVRWDPGRPVPSGSTLWIQARASRPLESAALHRSGMDSSLLEGDAEGRAWRSEALVLVEPLRFVLRGVDAQGLGTEGDSWRTLDVQPDLPPRVQWLTRTRRLAALPSAQLSLPFTAKDDCALDRVVLLVSAPGIDPVPPMLEERAREATSYVGEFALALSSLRLTPGTELRLRIEASDAVQRTESEEFVVVVADEDLILQRLRERLLQFSLEHLEPAFCGLWNNHLERRAGTSEAPRPGEDSLGPRERRRWVDALRLSQEDLLPHLRWAGDNGLLDREEARGLRRVEEELPRLHRELLGLPASEPHDTSLASEARTIRQLEELIAYAAPAAASTLLQDQLLRLLDRQESLEAALLEVLRERLPRAPDPAADIPFAGQRHPQRFVALGLGSFEAALERQVQRAPASPAERQVLTQLVERGLTARLEQLGESMSRPWSPAHALDLCEQQDEVRRELLGLVELLLQAPGGRERLRAEVIRKSGVLARELPASPGERQAFGWDIQLGSLEEQAGLADSGIHRDLQAARQESTALSRSLEAAETERAEGHLERLREDLQFVTEHHPDHADPEPERQGAGKEELRDASALQRLQSILKTSELVQRELESKAKGPPDGVNLEDTMGRQEAESRRFRRIGSMKSPAQDELQQAAEHMADAQQALRRGDSNASARAHQQAAEALREAQEQVAEFQQANASATAVSGEGVPAPAESEASGTAVRRDQPAGEGGRSAAAGPVGASGQGAGQGENRGVAAAGSRRGTAGAPRTEGAAWRPTAAPSWQRTMTAEVEPELPLGYQERFDRYYQKVAEWPDAQEEDR